jgi:hypothetical protein
MPHFDIYRAHIEQEAEALVKWVLEAWGVIAEAEPWLALPPDLDQDHLPQLVRELSAAALDGARSESLRRQLLYTAAEHGAHRRDSGFAEDLIHTEYHLLRRALWSYLRKQFGENDDTVEVILRVDATITLAAAGSLLGYHRTALEAAGRWPDGLEKVLGDLKF